MKRRRRRRRRRKSVCFFFKSQRFDFQQHLATILEMIRQFFSIGIQISGNKEGHVPLAIFPSYLPWETSFPPPPHPVKLTSINTTIFVQFSFNNSLRLIDNNNNNNKKKVSSVDSFYFDNYLRHLSLNALQLERFNGRFGGLWRFEIDEPVALAFVRVLIQDRLGRYYRSIPCFVCFRFCFQQRQERNKNKNEKQKRKTNKKKKEMKKHTSTTDRNQYRTWHIPPPVSVSVRLCFLVLFDGNQRHSRHHDAFIRFGTDSFQFQVSGTNLLGSGSLECPT